MESLSPQQSLNYWQNAKPLADSMWEFCDSDIRNVIPQSVQDGYREMRSTGINESYIDAIANECNSSAELNIYSQQIDSQINDMLKNVYEKINSGDLIAFGFQYPIESEFPTPIPLHMWPPEDEDIEKSAIDSNGFKYVNIRIIQKAKAKEIKFGANENEEIVQPEIIVHDKKVGRPSLKKEILEAYERLKNESKIDYSKSLKSHTELIQKTVQVMHPKIIEIVGMQYEAIRRTLSERFKADKNSL